MPLIWGASGNAACTDAVQYFPCMPKMWAGMFIMQEPGGACSLSRMIGGSADQHISHRGCPPPPHPPTHTHTPPTHTHPCSPHPPPHLLLCSLQPSWGLAAAGTPLQAWVTSAIFVLQGLLLRRGEALKALEAKGGWRQAAAAAALVLVLSLSLSFSKGGAPKPQPALLCSGSTPHSFEDLTHAHRRISCVGVHKGGSPRKMAS